MNTFYVSQIPFVFTKFIPTWTLLTQIVQKLPIIISAFSKLDSNFLIIISIAIAFILIYLFYYLARTTWASFLFFIKVFACIIIYDSFLKVYVLELYTTMNSIIQDINEKMETTTT